MPDYLLCGWRLRSDRPLPLLVPLSAPVPSPDIDLTHQPLPARGEPVVFSSPFVKVHADGQALIEVAGASLSILVTQGRHIVVDAAADTPVAEIVTFLLGPGLGLLCHQRRVLPLHAAAIGIGGRVIALVGASGAGKSTYAAALVNRGHRLISDDITVIAAEGTAVQPAYPSIKLWQDAADFLKVGTEALSRTRASLDKFHYPTGPDFDCEPTPLDAIVLLQARSNVATSGLISLDKISALAQLVPHIYRRSLARSIGSEQACLTRLGQLISGVPVLALQRSDGFADFERTLELIETAGAA